MAQIDQTTKQFNEQISSLQFRFQSTMSLLKADISHALNRQTSEDEFYTISLQQVMDRIKVQGNDTPSRILCIPNSALSNPAAFLVPVVCYDGSLQFANSHWSASYAYSYGSHLPHLDFSCSTTDTSSTTICEIQGIAHAISSAVSLGLSSLVVFSDSTSAINLATLATLCGLHQNKHLSRLSKDNIVSNPYIQMRRSFKCYASCMSKHMSLSVISSLPPIPLWIILLKRNAKPTSLPACLLTL